MTAPTGYAVVGRVRKPHGLRGELAVEAITDAPGEFFAPGRRVFAGSEAGRALPATARPDGTPAVLTVKTIRPQMDAWLIVFDEVADRNAAERFRGHFLLVPDAELLAPDEGEMFLHDLIGLEAFSTTGASYGTVKDVFDVPQGLLLEVHTAKGPVLVPFVDEIVVELDAEARRVVLDPPDGLFDA
jgi:16S rRNA processing protein RimM